MSALQLAWLALIWGTKTTSQRRKLPGLFVYSLLVSLLVVFVPASVWLRGATLLSRIAENQTAVGLGLSLLTLGAGLIYARVQRIWPFDEEYNFLAAQLAALHGVRHFFKEYPKNPWLGEQHPPLVPLAGSLLMRIFSVRLFSFRLLSILLAAATIWMTHRLGVLLFGAEAGLLSALFLFSFPLFLRMAGAAMLEMPVTFFTIAFLLQGIAFQQNPGPWIAIGMGVTAGLGLLSKYSSGSVLLVFLLQLLFEKRLDTLWPYLLLTVGVAAVFLAGWIVLVRRLGLFARQSALLKNYLGAVEIENPQQQRRWGLLGAWRIRFRLEVLLTRLPSAIGLYSLIPVALGIVWLAMDRGPAARFLLAWIIPIAGVLIVILPDHRYFLQIFPALALAAAGWLAAIPGLETAVLVLALGLWPATLVLFVDWLRGRHVFLQHLDRRVPEPNIAIRI